MIDWVSCKLPLGDSAVDLPAGQHLIVSPDGEITKMYPTPLPIEGSHESRLFVAPAWHPGNPARRLKPGASYIYLSGNPVKWWQGHNLWGTDDLKGLIAITATRLCALLNLDVSCEVRALWWGGYLPLTRVDSTLMFGYDSRHDVRAVLRSATKYCRSRHGAAQTKGSTVYLGLGSRRWTLKLYSKGDELDSKSVKHQLPEKLLRRSECIEYADTALRVELQMRSLELERRGLSLAAAWEPSTPFDVVTEKLEGLTMPVTHSIPSEVLERLPGRLVGVYEAWQAGHDLRGYYSRGYLYKLRKQLLECGVDILAPAPARDENENVVPLNRLIMGEPIGVPDWARDTELYFQPPRLLAMGE